MTPTRRSFIKTAGVVGAGLALGGSSGCAGEPESGESGVAGNASPTPMKVLILGGTGFIGPHTVQYALDRGHEVTTFTRGRSSAVLPDEVEQLVGDRNDDHTALEGRTWDVCIDNNCQDYRWARTSTELLKDAVQQYIFVSTISVYALEGFDWSRSGQVMREPLVGVDYERASAPEGWSDGDDAGYGHLKTLSEDIVHAAFPGRTTVVRPGLIVGPGDATNRFGYWPVRFDDGGEILAPGNPEHSTQIIDQRDLTEWVVRLAEEGTMGDFNGTGPGDRLSFGSLLEQIGSAVTTPHEVTWVPSTFLQEQGLNPWVDFPSWIPGDPLMYVDVSSAVASGLTFRSLATTTRDTITYERSRVAEEVAERPFGITREREAEVLAAWHAQG